MKVTLRAHVLVAALAVILVEQAQADPPPPRRPDPISLDRASPSVVFFGNTPGDIYGEPGGVGMGWDVGGPGPVLHVPQVDYGLIPGDNNDGHSNGEQLGQQFVIYFSGDDLSMGAPGSDYEHQAIRLQAAGDRFVVNGATTFPPPVSIGGGGPAGILGPILPPGTINLLSANQTRYNEIPSIAPAFFNTYLPPPSPPAPFATVMDDMDALELLPFDTDGDLIHDTPIYFTLDSFSPSLGAGFTGGDVFLSPPATPAFGLWAPFPSLGLMPMDEVDALAVWNLDGSPSPGPGDHAIFSLAPGSPTLAAMGLSPADVLATGFGGFSVLYLPHFALGMLPTDNIDGLDVEVFLGPQSIQVFDNIEDTFIPEPSTLALAAICCAAACSTAGRRRLR